MDDSDGGLELVVWGATGFVGRLLAEYLAESDEAAGVDWAIAGRDEQKLRSLRADLAARDEGLESLPILTADALDQPSLEALAERTDVICSTVGPYSRYGTPLVEACIEARTDYCDLTGEVHWMREIIDDYHEVARRRETRIVHACGFDSIPSDLGTYMVEQRAEEAYGEPCAEVKTIVRKMRGALSGGTFASMADSVGAASRDARVRKIMGHPYALNPPGEREGPDGGVQSGPRYDSDAGAWTAPFIMATSNEKVVRRSNALLDYRYGRDFRYSESMSTGEGFGGAVSATGVAAGLGVFAGALSLRPTRFLLESLVLPEPGEGPSREEIEAGYFEMELLGRLEGEEGTSVRAVVGADADPGYGATATMFGEAALSLAVDETASPLDGGVLTPASAFGETLVERLRAAGMTFRVETTSDAASKPATP